MGRILSEFQSISKKCLAKLTWYNNYKAAEISKSLGSFQECAYSKDFSRNHWICAFAFYFNSVYSRRFVSSAVRPHCPNVAAACLSQHDHHREGMKCRDAREPRVHPRSPCTVTPAVTCALPRRQYSAAPLMTFRAKHIHEIHFKFYAYFYSLPPLQYPEPSSRYSLFLHGGFGAWG